MTPHQRTTTDLISASARLDVAAMNRAISFASYTPSQQRRALDRMLADIKSDPQPGRG